MSSRPKFAPVAGRTANLLADEETGAAALDRPIGRIMRDAKVISDQQLQTILSHQRNRGVRFGEAAIHLGLATHEDIAWALSQQFRYAFAPGAQQGHPELVMASNPFGAEGEIFRELRSQLLMGILAPDAPRSALAFVSPDVRDGRTYVAANIAVAFSQLGGRGTLLIDADLRSPRQLELFGIGSDVPGLSSILSGRAESRVIQPMADLPNLYVLPAGAPPPNPLELVQRAGFGLLVSDLLDKFDHVVVDTPAASRGADCRVIAGACGAAVVLARKGRSRMDSTGALLRGMAKGSSKIAGVVMNEY
jgi:chain length determinant protein tyrosine kinase EpsG